MEIIEPRPYLSNIFRYEVSRKVTLELLVILKGVVELGKRHRTAFKPTVEYFVYSPILYPVQGERHLVYPRPVVVLKLYSGKLLELFVTSYYFGVFLAFVVSTFPNRHSGGPKSVSAYVPIRCALNCFGKPTLLYVLWEPVYIGVLCEHLLFLPGYIQEPA